MDENYMGKKEYEELTDINYWNDGKLYAIDISIEDGENELRIILKNKYKLKDISDIKEIFNKIRENTLDFIYDNEILNINELKEYIDISYRNKLLLIEIELYFNQLDEDIPDSKPTDKDLNILYPEQIKQIKQQYEDNSEFRNCVNLSLKLSNQQETMLKNISDKKINEITDDDITLISEVFETFSELDATTIYACMEKLDDFKPSSICDGLLIEEYLQLITIIFQYFDINMNINESNTEEDIPKIKKLIRKTIPSMKKIFKNLIDYSYAYPNCTNDNKRKIKTYDLMYRKLFASDTKSSYVPFEDIDFGKNFFAWFANGPFYRKLIMLVFIAFIFSQIVSLFTSNDVPPVAPK